jgi:hypothetical protein
VTFLATRLRANLFVGNNFETCNRTECDVLGIMTKIKSVVSLTLNTSTNKHFVLPITQSVSQLLNSKLYLTAICGDVCCVLPSMDSKSFEDTVHN